MKEKIITVGKRPAIDTIAKELGADLIGVEIGVNKGYNALYICSVIKPKILYLIDSWDNFFDPASGEIIGEAQYLTTKALLQPFNCCKIIKKTSLEAVKDFENESLDFIYIDADHSYNAVLSDILLWYSKVKKGGIASGHDFPIVQQAVINACSELKIKNLNNQNEDWWFSK